MARRLNSRMADAVASSRALRRRLGRAVQAALDRAAAQPMRWGRDDCALWVANIVGAALDSDPAWTVRGRYRSRAGAQRILGRGGLAAMLRGIARQQGWQAIRPAAARIGDVGIAATARGPVTVVRWRRRWWVGRNESGFTALRWRDARGARVVRLAWRVVPPDAQLVR